MAFSLPISLFLFFSQIQLYFCVNAFLFDYTINPLCYHSKFISQLTKSPEKYRSEEAQFLIHCFFVSVFLRFELGTAPYSKLAASREHTHSVSRGCARIRCWYTRQQVAGPRLARSPRYGPARASYLTCLNGSPSENSSCAHTTKTSPPRSRWSSCASYIYKDKRGELFVSYRYMNALCTAARAGAGNSNPQRPACCHRCNDRHKGV